MSSFKTRKRRVPTIIQFKIVQNNTAFYLVQMGHNKLTY